MPTEASTRYRVLKPFDYHPKPGVVMAFEAGEERSGLTKAAIERGMSLGALEVTPASKPASKEE